MALQQLNLGQAIGDNSAEGLRSGGLKINENFTELYGNFKYTANQNQLATHNRAKILMSGDNLTYTFVNGTSIEDNVPYFLIQNGNNLSLNVDNIDATFASTLDNSNGSVYLITKTGSANGTDKYIISQVGSSGYPKVSTISSLESLSQLSENNNSIVRVLGYYSEHDGGGGLFYWDSTSTESPVGGMIVKRTSVTNGRWKRIYTNELNPSWFGAVGDGVTDDTNAIRNMQDFINDNIDTVNFDGSKDYKITARLELVSNTVYNGNGCSIIASNDGVVTDYHLFNKGDDVGDGIHNITVKNFNFTNQFVSSGLGSTRRCIVFTDDSSNNLVDNCRFEDFYWNVFITSKTGAVNINADGSLRVPNNNTVKNCYSVRTLGVAFFAYKGARNTNFLYNEIYEVGEDSEAGAAILFDAVSSSESSNLAEQLVGGTIKGNYIDGTADNGITIAGASKILIENNDVLNCGVVGAYTNTQGAGILVAREASIAANDCVVKYNRITDCQSVGISLTGYNVNGIRNTITGCARGENSRVFLGSGTDDWTYSIFNDNIIDKGTSTRGVASINVRGGGSGVNCQILRNSFVNVAASASRHITFTASATRQPTLKFGDSFSVNGLGEAILMNDDSVQTLEPSANEGLVSVFVQGQTDYVYKGFYSKTSNTLTDILSGSLTTSTTGVLTGTTGADPGMTVSMSAGVFYVENRTGTSRNFTIRFTRE